MIRISANMFSLVTGIFQLILVVLFAFCTDYGVYNDTPGSDDNNSTTNFYPLFQDVHVMIFVGFGFLMTFLKKYSHGAVGYNMFISALVIQWATLVGGWLHNAFAGKAVSSIISIDLKTMITADFAAAAVLITFGAVLGKVSRLQLVVIGVCEVIFYYINENIINNYLQITDVGGSVLVHMFGAYFGLAVARLLWTEKLAEENEKEGSVYHSDVFAMIGTIFLWMYWPSFNGALLGPGVQQHRTLINTYYSLAACCVTTFVISPLLDKRRRLDMVHVQNATLAGGVAVGTCADLIIRPFGAIVIGMCSGLLSTVGYAYVTPLLAKKLKIHDTCGVNNLHGMPAILAAVAGAFAASIASLDVYGKELFVIWGARSPSANSTMYAEALQKNIMVDGLGDGRGAGMQAAMQLFAIVVTLGVAIVGGLLTGLLIRFLDNPHPANLYDDASFWITEDAAEATNGEDGHLIIKDTAEV